MSDKLSMPSYDKVSTRVQLRATTIVRLEKIQNTLGLGSFNAVVNSLLDECVKDVPFGEAEEKRLNEIIEKNKADRAAAKKRKGISK